MANTILITEKPVPDRVEKDAYILGVQENGNGQQALYRFPINEVQRLTVADSDTGVGYWIQLKVKNGKPIIEYQEQEGAMS